MASRANFSKLTVQTDRAANASAKTASLKLNMRSDVSHFVSEATPQKPPTKPQDQAEGLQLVQPRLRLKASRSVPRLAPSSPTDAWGPGAASVKLGARTLLFKWLLCDFLVFRGVGIVPSCARPNHRKVLRTSESSL